MSKAKVTFPSAPDTSAIDIKDEGSLIVSNPTAMNFTGPGVTVTENPTGTAEVSIPGLQYWTESEDAAVQQSTEWTPSNAATNVNAVILPKGTGANTAQTPDGTTAGGNARGNYATDWQKNRSQAAHVASGIGSTILGGIQNTASGNYSIAGNSQCIASGTNSTAFILAALASGLRSFAAGTNAQATDQYSAALGALNARAISPYSFAMGAYSTAYNRGMYANGFNYSPGQSLMQISTLKLGIGNNFVPAATDLPSGSTISLGSLAPPDANRVYNVVVSWTAVVIEITGTATGVNVGDYITQCNLFGFKRVAGTGSITSITTVATHGDASITGSASMAYTVSSNNLLATLTYPTFSGGGTIKMRALVKFELTEVAWTV